MKKEIRDIRIEPADGGGHVLAHYYKDKPTHSSKHGMGMAYQEPERHVFGEDEGHDMLAHVAEHLGIDEGEFADDKDERAGEAEDEEG